MSRRLVASSTARGCAVVLFVAASGLFGCAPRLSLIELPSGTWEPVSDGGAGWTQATGTCPTITTLVAQASLSGSIGGQRVRGTLDLGVTRDAARLDLVAPFGQALFYFLSRDGRATLWLTRENRVVRDADPEQLLAALTGIPLGQETLLPTLVGCPPSLGGAVSVSGSGGRWQRAAVNEYEFYLQRASARDPWRLVVMLRQRPNGSPLRAEYREFENNLPTRVLLYAADRFQVELRLSQIELNRTLGPETFQVTIDAGAVPMSLDELRQSGPLAERQGTP